VSRQVPSVARFGGGKPKVLLVDDHRGVLDTVSTLLGREFDVTAAATSGEEALESARRVDPDLIVLDINMPGLDGFQTFRALEQSGSRAAVVFLSVFDVEEHVFEAFRCSGSGYVLKSRAARDLPTALRQAYLGRRFAPSLATMCMLTGGRGHDMQVHAGMELFLDEIAAVFDQALRRGDATCVITTGDIRDGLAVRLRARGWPIGAADGRNRYLAIDAAEGLSRFMRNGVPDAGLLAATAAELEDYRRTVVEGETNRLTIFGNMSEQLIADGNTQAALALESLWHQLTCELPFYTVCVYRQSCFEHAAPDVRLNVSAKHDVVSHASDV
jgi:DNA-binding NarL/FixJ family response regulator